MMRKSTPSQRQEEVRDPIDAPDDYEADVAEVINLDEIYRTKGDELQALVDIGETARRDAWEAARRVGVDRKELHRVAGYSGLHAEALKKLQASIDAAEEAEAHAAAADKKVVEGQIEVNRLRRELLARRRAAQSKLMTHRVRACVENALATPEGQRLCAVVGVDLVELVCPTLVRASLKAGPVEDGILQGFPAVPPPIRAAGDLDKLTPAQLHFRRASTLSAQ